ncbi:MAG: lytic transglycosylase domain-containing protein [Thermoflavifilum sp.]|nr:lytic transglycosylase domain-containing protein [Thermoflavifilum sp.]MCL6513022.1 lytic transglycosylase domain-containing protein [Alicyclobacillus sp.]
MADPARPGEPRWRILILNRRVLISLVLLICVIFIITSNTFWRWMYPIEYQSLIQTSARGAQLDPLLVASVIRVESQFRSEDVSHAGAVGLMQLMPDTARWIAARNGRPMVLNNAQLAQPEVNIQLGCLYLRYLVNRFNGNVVAAIAAYNAGPQRVQDWLQNGLWDGRLETLQSIPVGETRHFVDRVFYNYDLYKRIYGADPAWHRA